MYTSLRFAKFAIMISRIHSILIFSLVLISICSCGKKDSESEEETALTTISVEDESAVKKSQNQNLPPVNGVRGIKVRNIGPLAEVFNDSNYIQLETAMDLGIEPITDITSAYFMKRPIVKISSNEYYQVDSLTHSLAYLVPEAADLLTEIGKNFIDSLTNRGGDSYRIKVTSLLRTPKTVEKLVRVNVNATDSSTHQYGTTFDLSYTNFYCLNPNRQINEGDLKNLLAEVLLDLKKQGKCYVKFEKKTACFHITARKPQENP